MTLRAATDSGVVVFPRLPVPSDPPTTSKRGQAPRKKNPLNQRPASSAASPQLPLTWRRHGIAAGALLGVGLVVGFIARPALWPPAALAEGKAQVAALTAQHGQAKVEIANLQNQLAQHAITLNVVQADLKTALQLNATLSQAQTALEQIGAAQHTRVTQLNHHLAAALANSGATLQPTTTGVTVRFSDKTWFVTSAGRGSVSGEVSAPPLVRAIDQLNAALAAPPSPLQRVQIRSVVRRPEVSRARRTRMPVAVTFDPWTQSALRAAIVATRLRQDSQLAITAAGGGATTNPRAASFIEIEVTLAN